MAKYWNIYLFFLKWFLDLVKELAETLHTIITIVEQAVETKPEPEVEINLNKILNKKASNHNGICGFWFKQFMTRNERETIMVFRTNE